MPPRRVRFHLIDLVFLVALIAWGAGILLALSRLDDARAGGTLGVMLLGGTVAALSGVWNESWTKRFGAKCVDCGHRSVPSSGRSATVCPRCLRKRVTPAMERRQKVKTIASVCGLYGMLTVGIGIPFFLNARSELSVAGWTLLALKAAGIALVPFVLMFAAVYPILLIGSLARRASLRSVTICVARARWIVGRKGEKASIGSLNVWFSGPDDPSAMISEQLGLVREQLADFCSEPARRRPYGLLVFDKRDDLVDFTWSERTDLFGSNSVVWSRIAAMTTEIAPWRLGDSTGDFRYILAYRELAEGGRSWPYWLRHGLTYLAAAAGLAGRPVQSGRLLVAIQTGEVLGTELFVIREQEVARLLMNWYDHAPFARHELILDQSQSLVEYLAGPDAPEDRRRRFRDFCKDASQGGDQEAMLRRHMDLGYEALLRDWRTWLIERFPTNVVPPSPLVEDALRNRVIPLVTSSRASFKDRLRGIRNMGRSGHPLGAEILNGLLAAPGGIPREEIVWALESITGRAFGRDREGGTEGKMRPSPA